MSTVLNFFAVYVWHLTGYAVAFHVLMPAEGGPFQSFVHSSIKVSTISKAFDPITIYQIDQHNTIMKITYLQSYY